MPDPGSGLLCGGTGVGGTSRMTCTVAKQRVLVQPSFRVRPEPVGEVHSLSLLVCLLPEFLQESSRGTVLEVPGLGETLKTYPLPCQCCESALGYRSHRLPCSYNS